MTEEPEILEGEIVSNTAPSARVRAVKFGGFTSLLILAGALLLVGTILVLILKTSAYIGSLLLPLLVALVIPFVAFTLVVLVPMAIIPRTRATAAGLLYLGSFLYGLTAWLMGFIITMQYWGVFWVIIGLVLAGIGVVPMGLVAAAFNHDPTAFWSLLVLTALALGTRYCSQWLAAKSA